MTGADSATEVWNTSDTTGTSEKFALDGDNSPAAAKFSAVTGTSEKFKAAAPLRHPSPHEFRAFVGCRGARPCVTMVR